MSEGKGSVVVGVGGFQVLIVVILLIQLAMVRKVGGVRRDLSYVKLPRGLKVRLERLLRWRLFGERRKMLPAELR
jgi:hypothetical protein